MQDLRTKRPIAVQSSISCFCHLDISSSLGGGPQDNHTLPGCHNWNRSRQIWDKSLPVVQFAKINWQNLYIFSRLLLQVAAEKSWDVCGVNKKKENQEDYFSGEKKCYFASGAFGIIGLAPNIPILPIIYAPLAPTTQILVFLSHTYDPFHLSQPIWIEKYVSVQYLQTFTWGNHGNCGGLRC